MPATQQVEEHQVLARIALRPEEEADNPATVRLDRRGQDQAETLMQKAVEELWRIPKTTAAARVVLPLFTACMAVELLTASGLRIQTRNMEAAEAATAMERPACTEEMA